MPEAFVPSAEIKAWCCVLLLLLLLLQEFYIAPLQDCLLRSAPSPASVKHNGLEGREEGDGVMNRYLAKSDRKPIPGRRASNRQGTVLCLYSVKCNSIIVIV